MARSRIRSHLILSGGIVLALGGGSKTYASNENQSLVADSGSTLRCNHLLNAQYLEGRIPIRIVNMRSMLQIDTPRLVITMLVNQSKAYSDIHIYDRKLKIMVGSIHLLRDISSTPTDLRLHLPVGTTTAFGQGYATEYKYAMIKFGFAMTAATQVVAHISPFNEASLALHNKLGFISTSEGYVLTRKDFEIFDSQKAGDPMQFIKASKEIPAGPFSRTPNKYDYQRLPALLFSQTAALLLTRIQQALLYMSAGKNEFHDQFIEFSEQFKIDNALKTEVLSVSEKIKMRTKGLRGQGYESAIEFLIDELGGPIRGSRSINALDSIYQLQQKLTTYIFEGSAEHIKKHSLTKYDINYLRSKAIISQIILELLIEEVSKEDSFGYIPKYILIPD